MEREGLCGAAGLIRDRVVEDVQTRREAVGDWEAGRTEPRPPKGAAYARLLEGLAGRFSVSRPADSISAVSSSPTGVPIQAAPAPEALTGATSEPMWR